MNTRPEKIQAPQASAREDDQQIDLSIVIPVYNEAKALDNLFARLEATVAGLGLKTELILVDDGSHDSTWFQITNYAATHFSLRGIALSRNFGKEAALTAGLHAVSGEAVVILVADCQDPPELLPRMIRAWEQGAEVVNMKRRSRAGESWFKRKSAALYYRLLGALAEVPIPKDVGDFRLMSRRVVDEVNRLGERNRYMKGLLAWPGFSQVTLEYERECRNAGTSKWNYRQLFCLSIAGITSFSNRPLRLASWLGGMVAMTAFVYGLWVFTRTLIFGDPVSGYPSMMLVILFLGGVQLITIGVLGEYVGRIFTEVKNRPTFVVREDYSVEASVVPARLRTIRS